MLLCPSRRLAAQRGAIVPSATQVSMPGNLPRQDLSRAAPACNVPRRGRGLEEPGGDFVLFFPLCDTYKTSASLNPNGLDLENQKRLTKTAFLCPEHPRPSVDTRQSQTDTRSVLQGVPIRRTTRRSQGKATLSSGCTRARIGCSSCKRSEPSGGLCRSRAGPPCPAHPTLQPRSAENTGITSAIIWPAGGMNRSLACVGRVARLLVPAPAIPQSRVEGAFGKSVCGLDKSGTRRQSVSKDRHLPQSLGPRTV